MFRRRAGIFSKFKAFGASRSGLGYKARLPEVGLEPTIYDYPGLTEGADRASATPRWVVSWTTWCLPDWIMALTVTLMLPGRLTGNAR